MGDQGTDAEGEGVALKAALEDLTACRAQLSKCKSELLATKIKDAVCKMQPENANLLR